MQALILAGGKGSRLRPLTMHTPKPVVPIANRPFLLYQIELLKRASIRDIVLSLSYQPHKIEDKIGDGSDYGANIRYTVEASPLGTAGAYRNARRFITETAVILNGDILADLDLNDVIAFHRERAAIATIVLAPVQNPREYGLVVTGNDSRVLRFLEKPKDDEVTCNTINGGVYILEPEALDYIPENEPFTFEYGLYPLLLEKEKPVYGYVWDGYWCDIGTAPTYLKANMDVINRKVNILAPSRPVRGEKFDETASTDSISIVDESCTLKPGVQITGSVVSRNCYIEERARIENSVIRGGSRIGPGAVVTNSVVGKGCHIGKSVTVAGSVLGDKSVLTDYSTSGK